MREYWPQMKKGGQFLCEKFRIWDFLLLINLLQLSQLYLKMAGETSEVRSDKSNPSLQVLDSKRRIIDIMNLKDIMDLIDIRDLIDR